MCVKAKKPRQNLQSTAIDESHEEKPAAVRSRPKNIIIDDTVEPKSPRGATSSAASKLTNGVNHATLKTATPRAKKPNYRDIASDDDEQENQVDKGSQQDSDEKLLNDQQRKLRSSKRTKI